MADEEVQPLPEGDYAIVEIMGHSTLIGRIKIMATYGTEFLQVEPIFNGRLLGPVLHGGASIYRLTMCSREIAFSRAPTKRYHLPDAVAVANGIADAPPPKLPELELRDDFADRDAI
jgi:hypothetical protein